MSTAGYGNVDSPTSGSTEQGATDKAKEAASQAATQGQEVAQNAAGQAGEVKSTAQQGVQQVAGEARQQAGQLASEATTQVKSLVTDAHSQVRQQAVAQTDRAAQGLRQVSQEVQALVQGRSDEAGRTGEIAEQLGDRLSQVANRLEDRGIDGVMDDVSSFARRNPGVFLVGCGAIGFAVGRIIRGAQAANSSNDSASGAYPEYAQVTQNAYARVDLTSSVQPATTPNAYTPQDGGF